MACKYLGAVVLWLVVAAPASATPVSPDQDPRLRQTVHLSGRTLYLGEALERLAKQSNVALSISDDLGPASGIRLSAHVEARPLHELLNAIATLHSNRVDRWEWRRSGPDDTPRYTLHHQRRLDQIADTARQQIALRFERDCWELYRAVQTGPAAEQALRVRRPDLVGAFGVQGVGWAYSRMLRLLDERQFAAVLEGERISIPMEQLAPTGRQLMEAARLVGPKQKDPQTGQLSPLPAGKAVEIFLQPSSGSAFPTLYVDATGTLGMSVAGPWSAKQWDAEMSQGWLDALSDAEALALDEARLPPRPIASRPWLELLQTIAQEKKFPFLAAVDLPGAIGGIDPKLPLRRLLLILARGRVGSQREGALLLFRHLDAWQQDAAELVSWPDIRSLRQSATANQGYLDLAGLARAARLTPSQWSHLHGEFPDLDPKEFVGWREPLLLVTMVSKTEQQALTSSAGLAVADLDVHAQALLFPRGRTPTWPGAERAGQSRAARLSLVYASTPRQPPALSWTVWIPDVENTAVVRRSVLHAREPLADWPSVAKPTPPKK